MKKTDIKYPELLKQEYKVKEKDRYKVVVLLGSWVIIIILSGLVLIYG